MSYPLTSPLAPPPVEAGKEPIQHSRPWLIAQAAKDEHAPDKAEHETAHPTEHQSDAHASLAGPEHATQTGHDGHGAEAEGYQMPHEIPNIATLIEAKFGHMEAHHGERPHPSQGIRVGNIEIPINPLFTIFYIILILWVVRKALGNPNIERPGKLQNVVEALLGGLRNFFLDIMVGIMGPAGQKYVHYVGSLWLFIWINNLMGLIPGLKAPTSSFKVTVALGLCTFFYVQYNALKESGFKGWFYHLLGSPTDAITWALSPLFLFLEIIGELIKPVSLSLRLFGNIFGEDKLLASFLGLGMMIVAAMMGRPDPPIGVPLHVIFYPLVVLTSTVQATVFALLASVYISLLQPHGHAHEHEEHGEHGHEVTEHHQDRLAGAAQA